MSEYIAVIEWNRNHEVFTDNKFSRGHRWSFDGGIVLRASASPHVVRRPFSVDNAVDPEEAFVASVSSCHMLTFLFLAAKKQFRVESYRDQAVGVMEMNDRGRLAISLVTLHPEIVFGGDSMPTTDDIMELHHAAHEECFIANSVKSDVRVEPVEMPVK